jgi:protein SCO1
MTRAARLTAASALLVAALLGGGEAQAAPKDSPWGRNYFPDVPLTTQDGKEVRFYTDLIENKHVVVSFIYTRCTKICGLMTGNLARVKRELGERVGKDLHFYSITLDPDFDTPAVLKQYAEAFHAGEGWTFLTGKKEDIALLRKKYGDLTSVEAHSGNVNIGNDAVGQWFAQSALDNPGYLVRVIGDWLDPNWKHRPAGPSYADAPMIKKVDGATALFREKCSACHSFGKASVGPDLLGVTERRSRRWLTRWLLAPEKLLQEKDATALALAKQYNGIPMPNLSLSHAQVDDLIGYLEQHPVGKAAETAQR